MGQMAEIWVTVSTMTKIPEKKMVPNQEDFFFILTFSLYYFSLSAEAQDYLQGNQTSFA